MMHDPFDRAEEALVSLEQRTLYDEKNRLELLGVHGVKGLLLGPLLYNFGGPDAWNIMFGAQSIIFLAAPAFFGGLLLLLGLAWNRNILLEAIGMILLLVWDLLMLTVLWEAGQVPYVVVIYGAFAALMCIHIKTLARYLWIRWKVSHRG